MLGIYGDDIGKVVGTDIEEFKQTLLYAYTKKNHQYYQELMSIYGKKLTKKNLNKVRNIFKNSGAYAYVLEKTDDMYNKSLNILNQIKWIDDGTFMTHFDNIRN